MKRINVAVVAALIASTLTLQPASVLAQGRDRRDRYEDRSDRWRDDDRRDDQRRRDRRDDRRAVPRSWRSYDYRHFEPGQRWYDPARYYRSGRDYRGYRMGRNDRIYRGRDNRYYCRRDDGTTGLIVGGVAGGILGSIIAPGDSKTIGAILGAGVGAVVGREIDNGVECR